MPEVAGALGRRNRRQAAAGESGESIDHARGTFAQVGFEFGVKVLDRVEVGRVGRQVAQPGFDGLAHTGDLVRAHVAHENRIRKMPVAYST